MKAADKHRRPAGTLHLWALDDQGHELWHISASNLIVASGYQATAQALAGVEAARIARVAVGTNGTEPVESDTSTTNAVTVDISRVEYPQPTTVRFHFTVGYNDAVGMSIREFGLLLTDGRLFSRKVRTAIEKTQYMSIVGMWDINI